jgi:hypothetical protein
MFTNGLEDNLFRTKTLSHQVLVVCVGFQSQNLSISFLKKNPGVSTRCCVLCIIELYCAHDSDYHLCYRNLLCYLLIQLSYQPILYKRLKSDTRSQAILVRKCELNIIIDSIARDIIAANSSHRQKKFYICY